MPVGGVSTLPVRREMDELQQVTEVVDEAPVIDSERTQQATSIDLARIAGLPSKRPNYLDFALPSPATASMQDLADGTDYRLAQTPQSGISRGGGNGFSVYGVESCINSGGMRLSIRQEAVPEFQIHRNTASAGFGRSSGRIAARTGRRNPNGTPQQARMDPTTLQNNLLTCDGTTLYHTCILEAQRRLQRNFAVTAHDTRSKPIDDFNGSNSGFSPMHQLCKRCGRSLLAFHRAHQAIACALFESSARNALLRGWNVAPIFMANSWRPFRLLAGLDVNGGNSTANDRPIPAGRNIGRSPDFFTWDLRISRRFRFAREGAALELIAEGFNLANRASFRTVNDSVGAVPLSALPHPVRAVRGRSATTPLAWIRGRRVPVAGRDEDLLVARRLQGTPMRPCPPADLKSAPHQSPAKGGGFRCRE